MALTFASNLRKRLWSQVNLFNQLFYLDTDVWDPRIWALPSQWGPRPEPGYQLKVSLKFVCEVRIIAHDPAFLHLLRLQWDGAYWVDPLDQRNSEREPEH
jgi:hypothetical protein